MLRTRPIGVGRYKINYQRIKDLMHQKGFIDHVDLWEKMKDVDPIWIKKIISQDHVDPRTFPMIRLAQTLNTTVEKIVIMPENQ